MDIYDQVRALNAVKLLSAICRRRPDLYAAIQDFSRTEFSELAAVSRKDPENHQLRRVAPAQDQTKNPGQQAVGSGKVA